MLCWDAISRIKAWKFYPDSNKKSQEVETADPELIKTLQEVFEHSPKSEFYCLETDFESPRYFLRLFGGEGLLAAGEAVRNYTLLGDDLLYTPRSRLWAVLEKLVPDDNP